MKTQLIKHSRNTESDQTIITCCFSLTEEYKLRFGGSVDLVAHTKYLKMHVFGLYVS